MNQCLSVLEYTKGLATSVRRFARVFRHATNREYVCACVCTRGMRYGEWQERWGRRNRCHRLVRKREGVWDSNLGLESRIWSALWHHLQCHQRREYLFPCSGSMITGWGWGVGDSDREPMQCNDSTSVGTDKCEKSTGVSPLLQGCLSTPGRPCT